MELGTRDGRPISDVRQRQAGSIRSGTDVRGHKLAQLFGRHTSSVTRVRDGGVCYSGHHRQLEERQLGGPMGRAGQRTRAAAFTGVMVVITGCSLAVQPVARKAYVRDDRREAERSERLTRVAVTIESVALAAGGVDVDVRAAGTCVVEESAHVRRTSGEEPTHDVLGYGAVAADSLAGLTLLGSGLLMMGAGQTPLQDTGGEVDEPIEYAGAGALLAGALFSGAAIYAVSTSVTRMGDPATATAEDLGFRTEVVEDEKPCDAPDQLLDIAVLLNGRPLASTTRRPGSTRVSTDEMAAGWRSQPGTPLSKALDGATLTVVVTPLVMDGVTGTRVSDETSLRQSDPIVAALVDAEERAELALAEAQQLREAEVDWQHRAHLEAEQRRAEEEQERREIEAIKRARRADAQRWPPIDDLTEYGFVTTKSFENGDHRGHVFTHETGTTAIVSIEGDQTVLIQVNAKVGAYAEHEAEKAILRPTAPFLALELGDEEWRGIMEFYLRQVTQGCHPAAARVHPTVECNAMCRSGFDTSVECNQISEATPSP